MNKPVQLKSAIAALLVPLIVAGCFSSNPTRSGSGEGEGSGEGTVSKPMPPSQDSMPQPGTQGDSRTRGKTARDSTATAPRSGDVVTQESTQGSTTGEKDGGRLPGQSGGEDGAADIRVASVEKSGAGTNDPDAVESDIGSDKGVASEDPEVGVAEALEGANAAVDAAADAVSEAEAAIARARETPSDAAGGGEQDSFDPWVTPGAGEKSATDKAGGGQRSQRSDGEGAQTAAAGGGDDATAGEQEQQQVKGGQTEGNDSFDPFADYGEQSGAPGQPINQPREGSLQIAEDAVATARAALSRARRALITAAEAARPGTGDRDAEAVQLAAAQAAMEAAAEAVIASAIAVMAASDAYASDTDAGESDESQELAQESIAKVVAVIQRDMRNAADALEATGDLLEAAGSLMGVLGGKDDARHADEERGEGEDPGDRVASLEDQLDQSLAVFDDRMHAEGSSIVRGMGGEDSELSTAADAGSSTDPRAGESSQRNARNATSRQASMDGAQHRDVDWNVPGNPQASNPEVASEHEQDYDIETVARVQDDDIIARQLREAAMAEEDPELKAALWDEYRNYKESLESGEAEAN